MDSNPPGSSVHRRSQARILEWVAISPPGDFPNPGIKSKSPALAHGFFPTKPPGKPFFLTPKTFCMGVSKITVDGDYSHEIKRCLLLGRKVMTNLGSILKSRDITLPTKVHLVKAVVFSVVMYGFESWTVKKAERQRTDAFELWWWRRLLRVPWTEGDPTSPF